MPQFIGLALAGLVVASGQTPPIFNPGAPGAPSRVVTPAESVALGRTTFTTADVQFMQHMIVHHAQAVEMVDLLKMHGDNATVRRLGERIALSQDAEMVQMRDWLTVRGQALSAPDLHAGHGMDHAGMDHAAHGAGPSETPLMPGMLSPAQMQRLAAARGRDFDRLFLQGMIQHHQGALDMVNALNNQHGSAEDPQLSDFLTGVVADQNADILRMNNLLSTL